MKKQKQHWFAPYKKWAIGAAISIVVIPALTLSWKNLQAIWAAPEKVESIDKKVEKHETSQEHLARLVVEQQARLDKSEAITDLQIKNLKELLKEIKS